MPLYEYRCEDGHTFEVMQRMSDDPVQSCETCGRPVQRVFHPVAVHFKGSGFYNTDYGKRRRGGSSDESSGESEAKKAEGGDSKEKKTETPSKDSSASASSSSD